MLRSLFNKRTHEHFWGNVFMSFENRSFRRWLIPLCNWDITFKSLIVIINRFFSYFIVSLNEQLSMSLYGVHNMCYDIYRRLKITFLKCDIHFIWWKCIKRYINWTYFISSLQVCYRKEIMGQNIRIIWYY
jgi:hypothetical protein